MVIPGYQNVGRIHNLTIPNTAFENVAKLKYFETTPTDQNFFHEEMSSSQVQGMLTISQFRIFCLPVSSLKT
jgi:hypothetical protein